KVVREEKEGIAGELKVVREEKEGIAGELKVVREEKEGIAGELKVVREEKEGIAGELKDSLEESELCMLQLHQVQEELEHYFLEGQSKQSNYQILLEECARKDEKLVWLRNQRTLLIGLIKYQAAVFQRFTAISVRLTRALSSSRNPGRPNGLLPFRHLKAFWPRGARLPGKNQPIKLS
ncbi:MAG: hypothetical protein WED82_06500, partial [Balneolales bacterium]